MFLGNLEEALKVLGGRVGHAGGNPLETFKRYDLSRNRT